MPGLDVGRMNVLTRLMALSLAGAMPALLSVVPLAPEPVVPPAAAPDASAAEPQVLDLATDAAARMTVPVNIQGKGPFNFIVDTGSERTVIAKDLAQRLGLDSGAVGPSWGILRYSISSYRWSGVSSGPITPYWTCGLFSS